MDESQKSLQKLTDSEQPTSHRELVDHIYRRYPPLPQDAPREQKQAQQAAIEKELLKSPLTPESRKEEIRNTRWQANHEAIIKVIDRFITKNGRMLSAHQIAIETGLSRQTVNKHLQDFHQSNHYQNWLNQFQALSERILVNLYSQAIAGNVRAAKVYLDALGGLPTPLNRANPTENANYIQVNNNIKIDQLTFSTLPESVQQEIVNLILQGLQKTSY